jgi:hypothetical protein
MHRRLVPAVLVLLALDAIGGAWAVVSGLNTLGDAFGGNAPCTVSYVSKASIGDKMTVNFYSSTSRSTDGYAHANRVLAAAAAGGVAPECVAAHHAPLQKASDAL